MRRLEDVPIDPEVAAALDAIDATLAGEPVDPRNAEIAELALLLAAERPSIDGTFATLLDENVEQRFATPRPARQGEHVRMRRPWRWLAPAGGLLTAGVAAAVAVVVVAGSGGSPQRLNGAAGVNAAASATSASSSSSASKNLTAIGRPASAKHAVGSFRTANTPTRAPATESTLSSSRAASTTGAGSSSGSILTTPVPPALEPFTPNGRKIVQGAQLALSAAATRVDQVAQEVFVVVGQQNGLVDSSSVTQGGPSGYAEFELSFPSGSLSQAMAALSTLRYARVVSRTDTTQDVTNQYNGDEGALADARALRTSLLKQLANATTQEQIDSLTARIHDAEASISSDEATLRTLNHQIAYSQVNLTINAAPIIVTPAKSGSFTIGRGAHDAGRVLTVAAAVALIVGAALLPLALLAALAWWIATALRRRRREHALDVV
jgi:hypothetical protein